jgi:nucleoside phosphorylase
VFSFAVVPGREHECPTSGKATSAAPVSPAACKNVFRFMRPCIACFRVTRVFYIAPPPFGQQLFVKMSKQFIHSLATCSWVLAACGFGAVGVFPLKAETMAFFYALDADYQSLRDAAQPARQSLKVGSRNIAVLELGPHRIYAVKMGSGAVETAASAQALLARVQCDLAFSVGPVGALSDSTATGTWYRVSEVVSYQKGTWSKVGFESAPSAVTRPNSDLARLNLPDVLTNTPAIKVASGEIFVASDHYRTQLHQTTGAEAVDMNLFGLLTVCADHQVPVYAWRIASDRADDHASEEFRKFVATYDGAGGKAVAEIIQNLPANPDSPESYPNLKQLLTK